MDILNTLDTLITRLLYLVIEQMHDYGIIVSTTKIKIMRYTMQSTQVFDSSSTSMILSIKKVLFFLQINKNQKTTRHFETEQCRLQ